MIQGDCVEDAYDQVTQHSEVAMKPQSLTLFSVPQISTRDARVHAMKNCLSVITAVAHLCQRDLPERSLERMARLKSAAARLQELIEQDLRPGDGAASDGSCEHTPACVASLVQSVTERLADRAEVHCVELFIQCGGGHVHGDRVALGEALFNLMANAIEATPEGGGVFLATSVTGEGDQHWCVQDTGRGIPPEQFPELGKLFCSRRQGGSGLGLALAQEAVARQGGLIRVESAPESGTTISVWLPRERAVV